MDYVNCPCFNDEGKSYSIYLRDNYKRVNNENDKYFCIYLY